MKNVLIVDDSDFMRRSLKNVLIKNGFNVIDEASNGAEGVSKYILHKPDLVTMDLTMPIMSGIEAIGHIKTEDPNAKVIVVSAMGQEGFVKDAIFAGAKSFIVKPFREDHIIKTINQVLSS